jgi:arabinofuranosyltransferase
VRDPVRLMRKHLPALLLLPLMAVLVYFQWQYKGYVKDDTYISIRYAMNLASGHGMVFNHGDKLEGYTNFLWILFTLPAYWLDIDPLNWVKVMGCVFGVVGVAVTWALARFWNGGVADPFCLLAAGLYATSPSVILWSQGGLEPPLVAVACSGGTLFAFRLWARKDESTAMRDAILASVLLTAGALSRPDAHAVLLVAGGMGVVDMIRRRAPSRPWLVGAAIIIGTLAPYHVWRRVYFGDWLPNTAYVKAMAGPEVLKRGIEFATELLTFCANPGIFALAALSLFVVAFAAVRKVPLAGGLVTRLWALFLAAFFVAYLVKIGRDEMKWFRLYLPVYPLAIALAVDVVRQLGRAVGSVAAGEGKPVLRAATAWIVALGLLGAAGGVNLAYADSKSGWHDNYRRWSERSFRAMGRHIAERSEPGDVVAFQDMGAAPIAANDQIWIDTIGILNRFVAKELAAIELNPFMRGEKRRTEGGAKAVKEFDDTIREYVYDQDPAWLAFIAYVPKSGRSAFKKQVKRLERDGDDSELEEHFLKRIHGNSHAHGITKDRRFGEDYSWERYWKRNDGYWVVLYRRDGHGD